MHIRLPIDLIYFEKNIEMLNIVWIHCSLKKIEIVLPQVRILDSLWWKQL